MYVISLLHHGKMPDASAVIDMNTICVNNTFPMNSGYVDERAGVDAHIHSQKQIGVLGEHNILKQT